jgi:hypothetical protein
MLDNSCVNPIATVNRDIDSSLNTWFVILVANLTTDSLIHRHALWSIGTTNGTPTTGAMPLWPSARERVERTAREGQRRHAVSATGRKNSNIVTGCSSFIHLCYDGVMPCRVI